MLNQLLHVSAAQVWALYLFSSCLLTQCVQDHQELYAAVLDSDLEETVADAP